MDVVQSVKRKQIEEYEEVDECWKKRRIVSDDDDGICGVILSASAAGIISGRKERKLRGPKLYRDQTWWEYGYQHWEEEEFKTRLRISRQTFEFILGIIHPYIVKQATNLNANPTSP